MLAKSTAITNLSQGQILCPIMRYRRVWSKLMRVRNSGYILLSLEVLGGRRGRSSTVIPARLPGQLLTGEQQQLGREKVALLPPEDPAEEICFSWPSGILLQMYLHVNR
jgi:hypothetical protein